MNVQYRTTALSTLYLNNS